MSELIERYEHVKCRKSEGAHYTPSELSAFVAKQIIAKSKPKAKLVIADPAIGDGELILSLLEYIGASVEIDVYGFDTNIESVELSRSRILEFFPNIKLHLFHADFLSYCLDVESGNGCDTIPKFDLIIANPPYVRTQVLGAEQAQLLAKNFSLKGRVDIYQAFLVGMSQVLQPDGVAGVIVSNRFLTTKGAGELRKSLHKLYDIYNIWDFGDTKLFEAAVLPAVLLFSIKNNDNNIVSTNFSSIYQENELEESKKPVAIVNSCIDALDFDGSVQCLDKKSYIVKKGKLTFDSVPKDIWRIEDKESELWLKHVEKYTHLLFSDVGKIRVGVKTTADNIFIRQDWLAEIGSIPELVRPLLTHHVAGRFKRASNNLKGILYTHEIVNGKKKAVNIDNFKISKEYLEQHKEQLEGRGYLIKAKRQWYEIWVPQDPALWQQPKVVFRDISEEPTFWLDIDNSVVNGDCYWMTLDNKEVSKDILWLILAVANSKFIEKFYDIKFNNKLYSNKRRYITQYVEKFPLPDPTLEISKKMINIAKEIYSTLDRDKSNLLESELNELVWKCFKLN